MENFYYSVPTKVQFGKGAIEKLPDFVNTCKCGIKAMLIYGGGSIKKTGLYDKIVSLLDENGIEHIELSGVEPNPRLATVKKGIDMLQDFEADCLIAIGGGSVIDCAKAISAGYYYDGDPWDLTTGTVEITKALPIIAVLTLSATGSEMDGSSIISNPDIPDKREIWSELLYPKYSILDPEYTYTVSPFQTACGTFDMFNHVLEIYFNGIPDTYMDDRIMEGLMKTMVHFGPIAVKDPKNYDARAELMWAGSWAINGFIACGKHAAWECHGMEHQLSAYYDITHGLGLAILTPHWLEKLLCDKTLDTFVNFGMNVFDIREGSKEEIAKASIQAVRDFITSMHLPLTLKEAGIPDDKNFKAMAEASVDECQNHIVPLSVDDIVNIYKAAL